MEYVFLGLLLAISLVPVLLVAVGAGRMFWRMWRHNEQVEPGGSMSKQMFWR